VSPWVTVSLIALGSAAVVGWLLPAWAMKRFVPSLEGSGPRVTNYRGRSIPTGLGAVWLVWATGVAVVDAALVYLVLVGGSQPETAAAVNTTLGIMGPLTLLVPGAFAFGLVDDLFGGHAVKGFRGHMGALARGRLTTGGLKLLGIGFLSLVAGFSAVRQVVSYRGGWMEVVSGLAAWACAALVIALAANLVNLTDLRPGRALKVYSVLATIGVGLATLTVWTGGAQDVASSPPFLLLWIGCFKLSLLALVLGPVVAVWRFDLGERAMLGDAGANAMGALAGFLLAWRSPLWLLAVLAMVFLVLNLASERVSFSNVIEGTAFLRWLDGLGRLRSVVPGSEATAETAAPDVAARSMRDGE